MEHRDATFENICEEAHRFGYDIGYSYIDMNGELENDPFEAGLVSNEQILIEAGARYDYIYDDEMMIIKECFLDGYFSAANY